MIHSRSAPACSTASECHAECNCDHHARALDTASNPWCLQFLGLAATTCLLPHAPLVLLPACRAFEEEDEEDEYDRLAGHGLHRAAAEARPSKGTEVSGVWLCGVLLGAAYQW